MSEYAVNVQQAAGDAPLTYTVSDAQALEVLSAFATFDGAAAAGAFRPSLAFYADGGLLVARVFPSTQVAAGDAADVTFAPFLGSDAAAAPAGSSSIVYAYATRGVLPDVIVPSLSNGVLDFAALTFDSGLGTEVSLTGGNKFVFDTTHNSLWICSATVEGFSFYPGGPPTGTIEVSWIKTTGGKIQAQAIQPAFAAVGPADSILKFQLCIPFLVGPLGSMGNSLRLNLLNGMSLGSWNFLSGAPVTVALARVWTDAP